ncbi:DsbA family protein [Shewanella aestuarii]|nr:DsbA family protein [Shewanella aestuarii]
MPDVTVQYVLGGLAADSDVPMPKDMQQFLQQTWHKIHQQLGTVFNHDFWTRCQPRRSTYPSCRAAIIARQSEQEAQMIHAIQQAYYLQAKNPSNIEVLTDIAVNLGIEKQHFMQQMRSDELNQQLMTELAFARQLPIQGFPSLVLQYQHQLFPILLDYQDADPSLNHIKQLIKDSAQSSITLK